MKSTKKCFKSKRIKAKLNYEQESTIDNSSITHISSLIDRHHNWLPFADGKVDKDGKSVLVDESNSRIGESRGLRVLAGTVQHVIDDLKFLSLTVRRECQVLESAKLSSRLDKRSLDMPHMCQTLQNLLNTLTSPPLRQAGVITADLCIEVLGVISDAALLMQKGDTRPLQLILSIFCGFMGHYENSQKSETPSDNSLYPSCTFGFLSWLQLCPTIHPALLHLLSLCLWANTDDPSTPLDSPCHPCCDSPIKAANLPSNISEKNGTFPTKPAITKSLLKRRFANSGSEHMAASDDLNAGIEDFGKPFHKPEESGVDRTAVGNDFTTKHTFLPEVGGKETKGESHEALGRQQPTEVTNPNEADKSLSNSSFETYNLSLLLRTSLPNILNCLCCTKPIDPQQLLTTLDSRNMARLLLTWIVYSSCDFNNRRSWHARFAKSSEKENDFKLRSRAGHRFLFACLNSNHERVFDDLTSLKVNGFHEKETRRGKSCVNHLCEDTCAHHHHIWMLDIWLSLIQELMRFDSGLKIFREGNKKPLSCFASASVNCRDSHEDYESLEDKCKRCPLVSSMGFEHPYSFGPLYFIIRMLIQSKIFTLETEIHLPVSCIKDKCLDATSTSNATPTRPLRASIALQRQQTFCRCNANVLRKALSILDSLVRKNEKFASSLFLPIPMSSPFTSILLFPSADRSLADDILTILGDEDIHNNFDTVVLCLGVLLNSVEHSKENCYLLAQHRLSTTSTRLCQVLPQSLTSEHSGVTNSSDKDCPIRQHYLAYGWAHDLLRNTLGDGVCKTTEASNNPMTDSGGSYNFNGVLTSPFIEVFSATFSVLDFHYQQHCTKFFENLSSICCSSNAERDDVTCLGEAEKYAFEEKTTNVVACDTDSFTDFNCCLEDNPTESFKADACQSSFGDLCASIAAQGTDCDRDLQCTPACKGNSPVGNTLMDQPALGMHAHIILASLAALIGIIAASRKEYYDQMIRIVGDLDKLCEALKLFVMFQDRAGILEYDTLVVLHKVVKDLKHKRCGTKIWGMHGHTLLQKENSSGGGTLSDMKHDFNEMGTCSDDSNDKLNSQNITAESNPEEHRPTQSYRSKQLEKFPIWRRQRNRWSTVIPTKGRKLPKKINEVNQ